jgi:hypothetical protein
MVLNAIIFNMFWLYYYYHANIHPTVIFYYLIILNFK